MDRADHYEQKAEAMERAAEENPGLEEYYRELARNWRSLAKAAREMETRGN